MTGPFLITGQQLAMLRYVFADADPHTLRVWFDELDGGVKFKFDNGIWSPPLGMPEQN